jgi:hypothetical protein
MLQCSMTLARVHNKFVACSRLVVAFVVGIGIVLLTQTTFSVGQYEYGNDRLGQELIRCLKNLPETHYALAVHLLRFLRVCRLHSLVECLELQYCRVLLAC